MKPRLSYEESCLDYSRTILIPQASRLYLIICHNMTTPTNLLPMTPETKLRELERRAMDRLTRSLETPEFVSKVHASVIVLIWSYPAFGPYQSWCLIKEALRTEHWRVRRTTWERPIDYQRATDPLKQVAFMIDVELVVETVARVNTFYSRK